MNSAHLHLMVNHLPLFAALFGGGLLAYGLLRNHSAIKSAGLVLGVIAGLGGVAATQSGERAEEMVEAYAGVNETALEAHEEAGELAQWAAVALGVVSLLALVIPSDRGTLRSRTEWVALIIFLGAFGMVARTANLGGEIRHPEITDSASVTGVETQEDDDEHR